MHASFADIHRPRPYVAHICDVFTLQAIKFTPEGGDVRFQLVKRASDDASPGTLALQLTVSDSGIGIHKADKELIWLKYTKATNARGAHGVDRQAGAGLGLSICKVSRAYLIARS